MSELTPDSFWRSLRFFSYYRIVVALLLLAVASIYGDLVSFGSQDAALYQRTVSVYVAAAIALAIWVHRRFTRFATLLSIQVIIDVVAITLLMYASGGQKSGLGLLMLVTLAGAGLVGEGRMVLFFASVTSVAMLLEQGWRALRADGDSVDFFRTGLICVSFFVMAVMARLLARRVVANEELARARGQALDRQLSIGRRIIAEMADGVLVLDHEGHIQQYNAMASRLLGLEAAGADIRQWSPYLAHRLHVHARESDDAVSEVVRAHEGKLVRLRLLPGEQGGDAIVYVEDMERVQQQAQQLKLAALGRLTANIAHEIRNPLAAIAHAAELLGEDEVDPGRRRLAIIIGSNSQRLNRLVTDVLELGRRERAERDRIEWASYFRSFLDEFSLHDPSAAERIVAHHEAAEAASLRFDRSHLHRVLWNLLSNALRHASPNAGGISVTLREAGGRHLAIHIADDGPGIDANIRKQMFEPFITSHGKGTGLGLFIARELCESNAARLELVDAPPGATHPGAHFILRVERAE